MQRRAVRHAVKQQLIAEAPDSEWTLLALRMPQDAHRLEWEHEREFAFEGRMYDVVKLQTVGDSVFYWCWADDEETELHRRLEELFARIWPDAPQPNKTKEQILDFWKKLFAPPQLAQFDPGPFPKFQCVPVKIGRSEAVGTGAARPKTPPPEKIGQ